MIPASGIVCVNKPKGITSHDVVNRIRKIYRTKQVGHTGTLDPIATGVLPVMVGRAVKASEFLTPDRKEYIACLRLGETSNTGDITGEITKVSSKLPSFNCFSAVCNSFVGNILQTPPMYSALKVGGKKLVDLARKGIEVDRTPRQIRIFSITPEIIDEASGEYKIKVSCSKGTYIRTLIEDIGSSLRVGAVMTDLKRTKSGKFKLEKSYTLEQLEAMSDEEKTKILLPVEQLFCDIPEVEFPEFFEKLAKCGNEIYQKKVGTAFEDNCLIRLKDNAGEFYALGKVTEFPDGSAIKPIKFFVLRN